MENKEKYIMPSENIVGVLDHKKLVGRHMQIVTANLLRRIVEIGDVLPYTLETDEPITLMYMIDVACKLKRDLYGAKFQLGGQLYGIVQNTITYLAHCEDDTPCHWITYCIQDLFQRAVIHDYSKFSPEEFDAFEKATPLLKTLTYGTEGYKQALASIKPALQHHYQVNSHHPEYYEHGINDMTLIDVIEMVCDWMAAVQRVKNGDIYKGLEINKTRFNIDDQLCQIIKNTVTLIGNDPRLNVNG